MGSENFYDKLNEIILEHIGGLSSNPKGDQETDRFTTNKATNESSNKGPFQGSNFLRIPIAISAGLNGKSVNIDAVLDSGAATSLVIGRDILKSLGSNIEIQKESIAIWGVTQDEPELHDQCKLFFSFGNHRPIEVTAIISDRIPDVLMGNKIFLIGNLTVKDGKATLTPKPIIKNR